MPFMYILKCSDGSYYTGSTWNLEKRFAEHQAGLGANHTRKQLPLELVYFEECERVEDAYFREKQIQGWSRKKKEALMAGETNALHQLAACRNETHHSGFGSAGFGSAQPTYFDSAPFDSAQGAPADSENRSLSEAEGNDPAAKK
ncbi:MAG: GIY-YIG nuclease family protein [Gammaproteobacteria bacterium]